eukprot:TRINITY_DN5517_c0_g1_i3.p1 TRINITY_DN5517_c0_g1~~TRINITY_DN5517_c0_g1_i3.p1  ORF type:complete len:432 (-),score=131.82 TRINITY_DN5517_c0_g1_i3:248-1543(-)
MASEEREHKAISYFASGAGDSTVKIWKVDEVPSEDVKRSDKEAPGYVLAHTLTKHQEKVTCAAFDNNKELLATGSADKSVLLWKSETGALHAAMEDLKEGPLCVAFDTTGAMLAVGGWDHTIQLRKTECGAVIATLRGHTSAVTAVAFSPNGQTMASASRDGTVRLWNVRVGEVAAQPVALLERHSGVVTCVAFSHDGCLLATGGHDTRVLVWETAALTGVATRVPQASVSSPGGAGSTSPTNPSSVASCHSLIEHTEYVLAVAFPSAQGRVLASGSADRRILLWSTENFELITSCTGHTGPVNAVAFSSDATLLVSGARDRTIKVWSVGAREVDGAELWSSECVTTLESKPDGHSMNIECIAVAAEPLIEGLPAPEEEEEQDQPPPQEQQQEAVAVLSAEAGAESVHEAEHEEDAELRAEMNAAAAEAEA